MFYSLSSLNDILGTRRDSIEYRRRCFYTIEPDTRRGGAVSLVIALLPI